MSVLRGFAIIAISAVACALIGVGIGFALGSLAPAFYQNMFRNGNDPGFDPRQMGIGLGLTQGLFAGLIVGCVVVLSVAWYNSRRQFVIAESTLGKSPVPSVDASKMLERLSIRSR